MIILDLDSSESPTHGRQEGSAYNGHFGCTCPHLDAATRLSCRGFNANAVRLQLHTLAYNLANFMRTLALPQEVKR
jgi:hypothetical protein